jgi:hypothetical protein
MSRGKYLSLEEARKAKGLEQFAKEHPSEGDKTVLDALFTAMTGGAPKRTPKDE